MNTPTVAVYIVATFAVRVVMIDVTIFATAANRFAMLAVVTLEDAAVVVEKVEVAVTARVPALVIEDVAVNDPAIEEP